MLRLLTVVSVLGTSLLLLETSGAGASASQSKTLKYRVQITANHTVQFSDAASGLSGKSVVSQTYPSFPLAITLFEGVHLGGKAATGFENTAISGRTSPGTGSVAVTMVTHGCENKFTKRVKIPFEFNLLARPGNAAFIAGKQISAKYTLQLLLTTSTSVIPRGPYKCQQDVTFFGGTGGNEFQDVLSSASSVDAARLSEARAFFLTSPSAYVGSLGFVQAWKRSPARTGGGNYQLPSPADKIAVGKKVVITRNLTSSETVKARLASGTETDVRVIRRGQISFVFRPVSS